MPLSRRNKIVIAIVAAVVGIPLIAFFMIRENFFLVRFSETRRLSADKVAPLDAANPLFGEATARMNTLYEETMDSDTEGKYGLKADLDGDGEKDKLSGAPDKVNIKFSASRKKYRHRLVLFEKLSGIGLDDLDGDGAKDAWFTLGSKGKTYVLWLDPAGDVAGKQALVWDTAGKIADRVRTSFFDLDSDGMADLIIERSPGEEDAGAAGGKQYFWVKLTKAAD